MFSTSVFHIWSFFHVNCSQSCLIDLVVVNLYLTILSLCISSFPHLGQNLWFVYDSLEGVDQLLESLHVQGIRESELKQKIKKHYQRIEDGFNASKK